MCLLPPGQPVPAWHGMAWHGPSMAKQNLHAARGSIEIGKGDPRRRGVYGVPYVLYCTELYQCIMDVCLGGQPLVGDSAALICTASAGCPLFSGAAEALPESLPNCKRGPRTYTIYIPSVYRLQASSTLPRRKTANCQLPFLLTSSIRPPFLPPIPELKRSQ
jgi:hypothetical protein